MKCSMVSMLMAVIGAIVTSAGVGCTQHRPYQSPSSDSFAGMPCAGCEPKKEEPKIEYRDREVPARTVSSSLLNVPDIAVVVETGDHVVWTRTVKACGPDGKPVVATKTATTDTLTTQTVNINGSGVVTTVMTGATGGSCDAPATTQQPSQNPPAPAPSTTPPANPPR